MRTILVAVSVSLFFCSTSPCQAAVTDAEIKESIKKAVEALRRLNTTPRGGYPSLGAYAMMVGGTKPSDPSIVRVLGGIQSKISNGKYSASNHYYEAGVDLMCLESADPRKYRKEMEAIVKYILDGQLASGAWYYPHERDTPEGKGGDTSITQYALLGLWAAQRGGVDIPMTVWDRAAAWHIQAQMGNGAYAYHPVGDAQGPMHSMTVAGIGSLYICRLHLYPNAKDGFGQSEPKKKKPKTKFGVLTEVDLDTAPEQKETVAEANSNYKPRTGLGAINGSCLKGLNWMAANYKIAGPSGWPIYYLYGLERMASLANIEKLGGHFWYAEGAEYLVKRQKPDGTFEGKVNGIGPTSFGLMFLARATGKTLKRPLGSPDPVGDGLLAGGRGLPDDLKEMKVVDGEVKQEKIEGPLDQLLADLSNPESLSVESVQEAIVEKVQVGDREGLIGQKDMLVKLVDDSRVEVRRTAFWALGRCEDLNLVPLMLKGLGDPDLSVAIEARNALCVLTRRPRGFGLPEDPILELDENAPEAEKLAAAKKWRAEVDKRWRDWYLSIRPYEERDDVIDLRATSKTNPR